MSWLSGIRNALGMEPRVEPVERRRVVFAPSATDRIGSLADGWALRIESVPHTFGWSFRFSEGPALAPLAPGVDHPVIADIATLSRLDGTTLAFDGTWQIEVPLTVEEQRSAHPLSRRFFTSHLLVEGEPRLFVAGDGLPPLAAALVARPEIESVLLDGRTLSVERVDGVPWPHLAAVVGTILHSWALHGAVPVAEAGTSSGPLEERVWRVLQSQVLPGVKRDGGTLELVEVVDGLVRVRLGGSCDGCSAATLTLKAGVERVLLQALPGEVTGVESVSDVG